MAYTGNFATSGSDPFYEYNRYQEDPNTDWTTAPFIGGPGIGYLEQNQDAAYTRYLGKNGIGLGDTSPFAQYLQGPGFDNTRTGFRAALAEQPTLTYQNYLSTLGGLARLYAQFRSMSPQQRGVRYSGPTRTIADI